MKLKFITLFLILSHFTYSQSSCVGTAGQVKWSYWLNFPSTPDSLDLSALENFPSHPSGSQMLGSLRTPQNFSDYFASMIRGYISVPQTADYTFNVTGDDVYLKRLFSNLIDNAIKFTQDGGNIEMSLNQMGNKAVVQVKDNGMGIEPDLQAKVFARFYRTDQARSYDGAGLGLNIAKTICDAHGGTITINSILGRGTAVVVEIPINV